MGWIKDHSTGLTTLVTMLLAIGGPLIIVGQYKQVVDDLKERVAKLEAEGQANPDPRLQECARLAREAYADKQDIVPDSRADTLMSNLGCHRH